MTVFDKDSFEQEIATLALQVFHPVLDAFVPTKYAGRERDGVYVTEFAVHCVECTVSKKEGNTRENLEKLNELVLAMRRLYPDKLCGGWYITLHPLTDVQAHQLRQFPKYIKHETYKTFLARLIDSHEYLRLRQNYPFGSVQDPVTNAPDLERRYFVGTTFDKLGSSKRIDWKRVPQWISGGKKTRFVVTGEFGAGKSSTLREIFYFLAIQHTKQGAKQFPVMLNASDYADKENVDEALRKHARQVGLGREKEDHLMRAWRAGYCILIIDGFDEVMPRITVRDARRMRDIRFQALHLIRQFVKESPGSTPIVLAGRSSYFASREELREGLGISTSWEELFLGDFTTEQLRELSGRYGSEVQFPGWLPKRPLLVAYLLHSEYLQDVARLANLSPAQGWRHLLNRIFEREAKQIDRLPLLASDLKAIYGYVSIWARKQRERTGPISIRDLGTIYRMLFSEEAEGRALASLLRLPGLVGPDPRGEDNAVAVDALGSTGEKHLICEEVGDVASAGVLFAALAGQTVSEIRFYDKVRHPIGITGLEALADEMTKEDVPGQAVSVFLDRVNAEAPDSPLQVDLMLLLGFLGEAYRGRHIRIRDIELATVAWPQDSENMSRIEFENCYFERVEVETQGKTANLPCFVSCAFEHWWSDVEPPREIRSTCIVDKARILGREMIGNKYLDANGPLRIRLLCTVLHKTFIQSLGGRQEKALKSGIPQQAIGELEDVVAALVKRGILDERRRRGEKYYLPNRGWLGDVQAFLKNPTRDAGEWNCV